MRQDNAGDQFSGIFLSDCNVMLLCNKNLLAYVDVPALTERVRRPSIGVVFAG